MMLFAVDSTLSQGKKECLQIGVLRNELYNVGFSPKGVLFLEHRDAGKTMKPGH